MSSKTPNATDDEPGELSTVATDQWEALGRDLLRARLEQVSEHTVRDAFRQARTHIAEDEALAEVDIQELRHALEVADRTVRMAARASPETAPRPQLWEFLDAEGKRAYVEAVERRRDR